MIRLASIEQGHSGRSGEWDVFALTLGKCLCTIIEHNHFDHLSFSDIVRGSFMPLFIWKKSYEIGIAEIDTQHRNLVGIINELSDAMMDKRGYALVPHILEKLVDYIQFHFTTEEEIMRDTKYPTLDEHCQLHLAMTTKVLEFKKEYSKNHEINVGELLNFLCDWLKEHIVVSDKKLRAHIKGLKPNA